MVTIQEHELTSYIPVSTTDNDNNILLLNATNSPKPDSSTSIPLQPSRWKTKGILQDLPRFNTPYIHSLF